MTLLIPRSVGIFGILICCALLAACHGTAQQGLRYPSAGATDAQVCADLSTMPQDLTPYAHAAGEGKELLSPALQAEQTQRLRRLFFSPWETVSPGNDLRLSLEKDFNMRPERGYAENLRPFPQDAWQRLRDNANVKNFPSRDAQAITVRNTAFRAMPTDKPFFLNPDEAGEGYPFDYFQHTAVWMGTPIYISHISADGAWVLAQTALAAGWMPAADAALVDDAFMARWRELPLAALLQDRVLLTPVSGETDALTGKPQGVHGRIGVLLPLVSGGSEGESVRVLYPVRHASGQAGAVEASLAPGMAARVPLPLTPGGVAGVGNAMMGQAYGWGGFLENRDCSALMRDLFLPFGIWLPRNSGEQGRMGRPVELAGLSPDAKERRIQEQAVPFLSLLAMRGHITLYLGAPDGKPAMFHTMWGVRTKDANGKPGRAVIGKAAVTSLRPGAELPVVATPASTLDRIERISILP